MAGAQLVQWSLTFNKSCLGLSGLISYYRGPLCIPFQKGLPTVLLNTLIYNYSPDLHHSRSHCSPVTAHLRALKDTAGVLLFLAAACAPPAAQRIRSSIYKCFERVLIASFWGSIIRKVCPVFGTHGFQRLNFQIKYLNWHPNPNCSLVLEISHELHQTETGKKLKQDIYLPDGCYLKEWF